MAAVPTGVDLDLAAVDYGLLQGRPSGGLTPADLNLILGVNGTPATVAADATILGTSYVAFPVGRSRVVAEVWMGNLYLPAAAGTGSIQIDSYAYFINSPTPTYQGVGASTTSVIIPTSVGGQTIVLPTLYIGSGNDAQDWIVDIASHVHFQVEMTLAGGWAGQSITMSFPAAKTMFVPPIPV